jgi:hypothetical protein
VHQRKYALMKYFKTVAGVLAAKPATFPMGQVTTKPTTGSGGSLVNHSLFFFFFFFFFFFLLFVFK